MELIGPVQVGELELDADRGRVIRHGDPVDLPPLSFRLLIELVRAYPGVARTGELLESLWPRGFMTESNLKQRVYLLRRALQDDADEPRYVRTVRGWGYQLATTPVLLGNERPLVAVADVQDVEDDQDVSMALTAALRHGLEHHPGVSVVPSGRLADALRLLRHDPVEQISIELAIQAARRDGEVDLVVGGSVWRLGDDQVALELSVLNVPEGSTSDRVRVEAPTHGDLLGRLEEAIDGLRVRSSSVPRIGGDRRPAVTTRSLSALRCYENAASALDMMAMGRAQQFLEEAVAHDPEFATAWLDLAWTRIWNEDLQGARQSVDRARDLVDQLTEGERHHVLALASSLAGDLVGALNHYEVALTFQPNHYWATVNLAGCQLLADRTDEALESYRRALGLRPNAAVSHWNLAVAALTARGDLDEAGGHLAVVRGMSADFPFPLPWLVEGLCAWEAHDLDAAAECFAEVLAKRLPAAPALGQHMGMLLHARLFATRGRWPEAVRELERARAAVVEHGGWAQYSDLELALTLHEAGDPSAAGDLLEEVRRTGSSLYQAQAIGWLAVFAARAGERRADTLLDELATLEHDEVWEFGYPTLPAFTRARRCFPALIQGELALQAGELREARRWFREALAVAPRHVDGPVPLVALGPAPHIAALEGAARASARDDPSLSKTGFSWIAEHPVTVLMMTPAGAGPWSRANAALADSPDLDRASQRTTLT